MVRPYEGCSARLAPVAPLDSPHAGKYPGVRIDPGVGEVVHEAARVSGGRVKDGTTPSGAAVAATDVVAAPPDGAGDHGRRLPSKRRRRRTLAVFLAVWAVVVAVMGWAWYEYGRLSHELRVSNGRVAGPVQRALTPAPVGAARQTTMVAGVDSHKNVAGTVILARTDGTRHAVEILTVPSTVSVSSGQRLRDVLRFDGVPRAIGLLEHDLRVPVNHVLLIQLNQAGSIVRSLGGITITNPASVPYNVVGGRGVFPTGRVALTGRTVQWYLDPTVRSLTPGTAGAGDFRQAAVVRGVTDKLVHLTTPSAITAVGRTISRNFTTDLSPDPVLGIVAARLQAHTLVDCRLGTGADLGRARPIPTVAGFQTASRRGACKTLPLKTKLPAAAVAATIIATIVTHGGSRALYWLVVGTIAIWGIGACAWILMLPRVRGVRRLPRRALPAAPRVPSARRRALPRPSMPRRPHIGRPRLPSMSRLALPHVSRPALPHIGRPALPQVGLPGRSHGRHGRLYTRRRRRRLGAYLFVRVVSVPASIGLGMLIAHLLY
jgi:anionic cell wall polymer biosynthesis LytR-Cps2A-Psr (LCP) family protein